MLRSSRCVLKDLVSYLFVLASVSVSSWIYQGISLWIRSYNQNNSNTAGGRGSGPCARVSIRSGRIFRRERIGEGHSHPGTIEQESNDDWTKLEQGSAVRGTIDAGVTRNLEIVLLLINKTWVRYPNLLKTVCYSLNSEEFAVVLVWSGWSLDSSRCYRRRRSVRVRRTCSSRRENTCWDTINCRMICPLPSSSRSPTILD